MPFPEILARSAAREKDVPLSGWYPIPTLILGAVIWEEQGCQVGAGHVHPDLQRLAGPEPRAALGGPARRAERATL